MIDSFTFDGVSSSQFGARAFPTDSMLKAPAHKYDSIVVPGRSGALLYDNDCYDNIQREYDVQIVGDNALSNFNALKNYLASRSGYLRLSDTFDPEHYFMAVYSEAFNMTADLHSQSRARGTIAFNCKPQRFLLSGDVVISSTARNFTVTNPCMYKSSPLLRVYGYGIIFVAEIQMNISYHSDEYMDIDCETGVAYSGAYGLNRFLDIKSIRLPTLAPGVNQINLSYGISKIEITPRWWEL